MTKIACPFALVIAINATNALSSEPIIANWCLEENWKFCALNLLVKNEREDFEKLYSVEGRSNLEARTKLYQEILDVSEYSNYRYYNREANVLPQSFTYSFFRVH